MRPIRSYAAALALTPLLATASPASAQEEADTAKWSVQTSLGFPDTLRLSTDEGTWINLDVSPDGRSVVFDLMGDLYRVPVAGGAAERLTSGPAFDQLPRFSPDGARVAFISDRSGADQLWIMPSPPPGAALDTAGWTQVTDVDRWYPTNPWWTPDGDYLVVKRHVVDTRSLGGGEIWLYHRDGGDGAVLVERRSFTSDLNEPSVSPDGRYVYFSATGPFDYNKDVHDGIFEISRYDRVTGETVPLTGEAGGAARPVPSPDGRRLAFIRRIGTRTALMVRDLENGSERVVYQGLDRDQMETWTVHGAFPAFDWTPDSREIVVFSGGKITRVTVSNGATALVPFRAEVEVPLAETVHFDQDWGSDDDFRARLIRWPTVVPGGATLVFQAVGKVWRMRLPDGSPERITSWDALEYAPAVSPDGRWVAFTTWDADDAGALWKVPLAGGTPTQLTTVADQYANPAWSRDGSRIAFLQGSGRINRGAGLSEELYLRLRWVPAEGGEVRDVGRTANRGSGRAMPRLSWTEDDRIVYFENDEGDTYLTSVRPDGTDERRLAKNDVAEEMVLSPDGRHVAFKEYHQVYVAPLPQVGDEPVTLSATSAPVPVKRLTRFGGDWVDWAPDGRSVTWALGPEVVRQSLERIFAAPAEEEEGDPSSETNLQVPGEVFEIALTVPRAKPSGTVALTGARIITMRGDEVIEDGTVVVEDNRIAAVGPSPDVAVPEGARVVDVAGKTIFPGLIDVHAHMGYAALDINPERSWEYFANLGYGVTTTHDPSASTQFVFSSSELVEAGAIVGPRVYSTGFILYGASNPNRALVEDLDDARAHLKRLKAQGAFSVKSYNQLRRDARQWIIEAAREERMHVYPEGGSFIQQNWTHAIDGHTGVEHALPVAELYSDAVQLMAESGTGYTPTLIVGYGGVWGENYWYQVEDVWEDERLARFTPPGFLAARARRRMLVPEDEFYHVRLAETAHRIVEAGGQVQLGAHGQLQGLGVHWELWMFEQGGFTAMQALRAATLHGARYLGFEEELGSLEPGKLADLVVVDGNPLADIRTSDDIVYVMKNGFLYDEDVNEVWPRERPRGPFRF